MELNCSYAAGRRESRPVPSWGLCHALVCTDPPCLVARFAPFVETRKCFVFLPFVLAKRTGAAGGHSPSLTPCHHGDAVGTGQAAPPPPACRQRLLTGLCVWGSGFWPLGAVMPAWSSGPGEGPAEGMPAAGMLPRHRDWEHQMWQKGKELVLLS